MQIHNSENTSVIYLKTAQFLDRYEIDRLSGSAKKRFYGWNVAEDDIPVGEKWNQNNYMLLLVHEAQCKAVIPLF